jgi:hypothetical protein
MEGNNWSDVYAPGVHELRDDPIRLLQEVCGLLNGFNDYTLVISVDIINEIRNHTAISIGVLKTQEQRFE